MPPQLRVMMYHYVRDLPRTRFPRINGMLTESFRRQVDALRAEHEMATLESALAFWEGRYTPNRDLCLLTFDDGLKDHYTEVLPILAERRIAGVFFLITASCEERRVVSVHKNHFLMAALDGPAYRAEVLRRVAEIDPSVDLSVDPAQVRRTYRWDADEVAVFEYLLNHCLGESVRDRVLDELFRDQFGDERAFAQELYLSWEEANEMQRAGMVMGGHSHQHARLAALGPQGQREDLSRCTNLLRTRLAGQALWPFSYPYGKADTFDATTIALLKQLGTACAFGTDAGATRAGDDVYALRRVDAKSLDREPLEAVRHA